MSGRGSRHTATFTAAATASGGAAAQQDRREARSGRPRDARADPQDSSAASRASGSAKRARECAQDLAHAGAQSGSRRRRAGQGGASSDADVATQALATARASAQLAQAPAQVAARMLRGRDRRRSQGHAPPAASSAAAVEPGSDDNTGSAYDASADEEDDEEDRDDLDGSDEEVSDDGDGDSDGGSRDGGAGDGGTAEGSDSEDGEGNDSLDGYNVGVYNGRAGDGEEGGSASAGRGAGRGGSRTRAGAAAKRRLQTSAATEALRRKRERAASAPPRGRQAGAAWSASERQARAPSASARRVSCPKCRQEVAAGTGMLDHFHGEHVRDNRLYDGALFYEQKEFQEIREARAYVEDLQFRAGFRWRAGSASFTALADGRILFSQSFKCSKDPSTKVALSLAGPPPAPASKAAAQARKGDAPHLSREQKHAGASDKGKGVGRVHAMNPCASTAHLRAYFRGDLLEGAVVARVFIGHSHESVYSDGTKYTRHPHLSMWVRDGLVSQREGRNRVKSAREQFCS